MAVLTSQLPLLVAGEPHDPGGDGLPAETLVSPVSVAAVGQAVAAVFLGPDADRLGEALHLDGLGQRLDAGLVDLSPAVGDVDGVDRNVKNRAVVVRKVVADGIGGGVGTHGILGALGREGVQGSRDGTT